MNKSTQIQTTKPGRIPEVSCIIRVGTEDKSPVKNFNNVLLEALDEVFSVLGEGQKHAIYRQFEKKYRIRKEALPHDIESLTFAIEKMFGKAAPLVEIEIIRKLHCKVGSFKFFPQNQELVLANYLVSLRASMQKHRSFLL